MDKANAQSQPGVGIGVFVFKSREDRRFLLGLRKGSIGAGTWSLTGGHLEHNETFEQCAMREVKEETDLDIEDVQFLTAIESFFTKEGRHYVTVLMTGFVKGEMMEPKLTEPDKCEGWHWHSFKEMREINEKRAEDLFLPLRNLFVQRPDICASLDK